MPPATLAPRRAPVQNAPTPASAFLLETRLLKAYHRALHQIDQPGMDALTLAVLGTPRPVQARHAARQAQDREQRLDEELPELIPLLSHQELSELAPLLLEAQNLAAFARALLKLAAGNGLKKREPTSCLNDERLFKAAGMGKLARQDSLAGWQASQRARGLPTGGPPLVLTMWVPPVAKRPRVAHPWRMSRPAELVRAHGLLFAF